MIASSLQARTLAAAFVILMVGALVIWTCAIVILIRALRKIGRYLGLPERSVRRLDLKKLRTPEVFDSWVAAQRSGVAGP